MSAAQTTRREAGSRKAKHYGSKWIRPEKRLAIYLRDGMACAYCGAGAEDEVGLSLDHITPWIQGGSNHESNLITCCTLCNSQRQDTPLADWLIAKCGERHNSVAAFIASHITLSLKPYRAEADALIARRLA